jgi:drug/metabolite transporter (DMT)-like permease
MSHGRAVALMVVVTLLWSISGVVTRHLDHAAPFTATFWRSLFNALAMSIALGWISRGALLRQVASGSWPLWVSSLCWAVMFTAFMVSITLTSVANVLVTMAVGPLITAVFARLFLHHRLPPRTWIAIAVASAGIAWMFGQAASDALSFAGTMVALLVPIAAAINWTLLQHVGRSALGRSPSPDMRPAAMIGALLSALVTWPLASPAQTSAHDVALLAMLGVVQLAVPCLLVVRLTRELPAAEIALLGLLEVLFGVAWAWLGAGERPPDGTLAGGALVLCALVGNEALALRKRAFG